MILERGNMWDVFGSTNLFMITTNPIVNSQGLAVMGRGIAKEMADRFPIVRKDFADRVLYDPYHMYSGWIGNYDDQPVGYFMVKDHWAVPAKLDIIRKSIAPLLDYIEVVFVRFRK